MFERHDEGTMRVRGLCSGTGFCAVILAAALAGASAEEKRDGSGNMTPWETQPGAPDPDLSPLPNFKGDFISMGANGAWNIPPNGRPMLGREVEGSAQPVELRLPPDEDGAADARHAGDHSRRSSPNRMAPDQAAAVSPRRRPRYRHRSDRVASVLRPIRIAISAPE